MASVGDLVQTTSDIQTQVLWNHRLEIIAFVTLVYDYILTLDLEAERFWFRSWRTLSAVLFYVLRYLSLLGHVPIFVFTFWAGPVTSQLNGCHSLDIYQQWVLALIQLVISTWLILRTYAIYGQNRLILWTLIFTATIMVLNGCIQFYFVAGSPRAAGNPAPSVDVGCLQNFTQKQGLHLVALWIGVVVLDFMVFVLTLKKTTELRRNCTENGLWTVIMRDGALYFGIITLCNLSNIFALCFAKEYMKSFLSVFSNTTACIVMSRLMFNLRDTSLDHHAGDVTMKESSSSSNDLSMQFAPRSYGAAPAGNDSMFEDTDAEISV